MRDSSLLFSVENRAAPANQPGVALLELANGQGDVLSAEAE